MEKKRAKNVRGSPQSWGYIHQKVSHACDLHFIKWLQSATINVAIPFYRTLAGYSLGSNFSDIHSIQNILQCTWDIRHDSCIFPLEQYLFPETIICHWIQNRLIHQFLVYTTFNIIKGFWPIYSFTARAGIILYFHFYLFNADFYLGLWRCLH